MEPKKLSTLRKGQSGQVLAIQDQALELAMMKYGLLIGDHFVLSDTAPLGGPIALEVEGNKIALRRKDAEHVHVKLIP